MSITDKLPTIESVTTPECGHLIVIWSDGVADELDVSAWLDDTAFAFLRDPEEFARVRVGDWGHSLEWPSGVEIGADSLWLETLTTRRRGDVRRFLEWRLKHGLSLTKAAEALGLARRTVAYYSSGEHAVPRHILLACVGWEADLRVRRAKAKTPALVDWTI